MLRLGHVASISLVALVLAVSGCIVVSPGEGDGYGTGAQQTSSSNWGWQDLEGMWCFGDNRNEMRFRDNGKTLIAQPVGRPGGTATLSFEGSGVYRDVRKGRATYTFFSPSEAVWRSNDNRNLVYDLFPC